MDPLGWSPLGPSCVLDGQVGYDDRGRSVVSGRITAIAVDPGDSNRIYAGTAAGGVWMSEDAGLNWRPETERRIGVSVGAMAVDSQNRRLYVAPGEANNGASILSGFGLLIHDPVAHHWTYRDGTLAPPQPPIHVLRKAHYGAIAIEDRAPKRIYLGGSTGLYTSDDDGQTWTPMPVDPAAPTAWVCDIAVNPGPDAAHAKMFVALWGRGIWTKTGPSGAWTQVTNGLHQIQPLPSGAPDTTRIGLAICKGDPQHMLAAFATTDSKLHSLYVSHSGGSVWTATGTPANVGQTTYNMLLAIHPDDPTIMFYGETRLWRSGDSGQSWVNMTEPSNITAGIHADQHALTFDPNNSAHIWVGNDGGVWRSTDHGLTWNHRNRGLGTIQFYCLALHPDNESVSIAGAQDNGTQRYEGHPAWRLVRGGDGFFVGIDTMDKRYWYSSYCFNHKGLIAPIFRSDRYGDRDSFEIKSDNIIDDYPTSDGPFYVPFVFDPQHSSFAYLGTRHLWWTLNRGEDGWTRARVGAGDIAEDFDTGLEVGESISALAVHPRDSDIVFVGTADGRFFRLQKLDGALNWGVTAGTGLPGTCISDIAVHPTDDDVVYVGIGTTPASWLEWAFEPAGRFFVSLDKGESFTARSDANLDLIVDGITILHKENPVNAVTVDPANPAHVYIGCDMGVFFSPDQGVSWQPFRDELPNSPVYDLQVHAASNLLRAATFGRGVWERHIGPGPGSIAGVELYIRDNVADIGRRPTIDGPDPLDLEKAASLYGSGDVKVDTRAWLLNAYQEPSSTLDYTNNTDCDYIGFEQLQHEYIRGNYENRIYTQIFNRGPLVAGSVKARAFWAGKDGDAFPNLPADFWDVFPDGDPSDLSVWTPLGGAQTIPSLRPGEPAVLRWDHTFPFDPPDQVGILVAVTSDEDPIGTPPLVVEQAVRGNRKVVLREVETSAPVGEVVLIVLLAVGVAAGIGLTAWAAS